MSATGRGTERRESDFYSTPSWAVRRLLEAPIVMRLLARRSGGTPGLVLDPCAGDGSLIRAARPLLPNYAFSAIELREEMDRPLSRVMQPSESIAITNYLETDTEADFILTNPPYSLAQEFIVKARHDASCVFMLLRLNFLASKTRHQFWKEHMPWGIFVLPNRPGFDDRKPGKTDATEYCWMAFNGASDITPVCSELHILGLTNNEERSLG